MDTALHFLAHRIAVGAQARHDAGTPQTPHGRWEPGGISWSLPSLAVAISTLSVSLSHWAEPSGGTPHRNTVKIVVTGSHLARKKNGYSGRQAAPGSLKRDV